MASRSKRYKNIKELIEVNKNYNIKEALAMTGSTGSKFFC